jgi:outer membrane receptor for ferrienterochelin and colicin
VSKAFSAKGNFFVTEVKDQIGYNASGGNLSTNIYTTKTMGVESELNYINGPRSGFLNVSYASRLDESIADTTVSASKTKVTWAPSLTANLGALREITPDLKVAAVLQYMGEVKRRTSDTLTVANADLRGGSIPAWYGLDANVSYKLTRDDQLDVAVRNIFDNHSHLIKNRDYNFDYQVEGINYYTTYTHYF